MNYHKLLSKQITRHLPAGLTAYPAVIKFLSVISESYIALERDTELAERAFTISEQEYVDINEQLKAEAGVKKLSLAKLKEAVGTITGHDLQNDSDDLLMIARYLNQQVSKRKNAEKVFTSLISNMQSGILFEDENRIILFANKLFCNLFNIDIDPDSLQGIDRTSLSAQTKKLFKYPDEFVARLERVVSERKLVTGELLEMANGDIYKRDYIPIYSENKFRGQLWSITDVTESKKAQDDIEQSELKNRLIMNSALDAIVTIDIQGIITFWNPQAEKIFGWRNEDVLGKKLSEVIIPNQHRAAHDRGMKHFIKTGDGPVLNKQIELPAINSEGIEFPIELSIIPVKQGNTRFFCSFIRDISERKKSKEELTRLSMVASANENGVIFTNVDGKITWCNEGLEKISGYHRNEIIGKTPIELFKGPLSNKEDIRKMLEEFGKGKSFSIELILYKKKGNWFWSRIKGQAIQNKDGSIQFFAMIEDISAVEAIQRKLKEYEEQLKLALTNVGDNYWEHNFKTGKSFFSNLNNTLLGFGNDEYVDGAALWWERVHPDDKALLRENDEKYRSGLLDHHVHEYRMIHKDGNIRWVLDKGVVVEKDDDNRPTKIIGAHIDITRQKNLELELTSSKDAAEASTRSKESFLANMSHEIRTPMNAIMGMANQLAKTALNTDQQFFLNTIHSAADNLLIIINDILDLSKIEAGKLSIEHIGFEPKVVVEKVMQVMMHKAEEKGLTLSNSIFDEKLSPILIGDPYRLNQVLYNLLSNAIKFTEKGFVDIVCTVVEEDAAAQTLQIMVKDTGIGMDKSFAKDLFQKFTQEDETVTRKFGGTGLGMSICKELVELVGGTISAQSEKGIGTTITCIIPFAKGTAEQLPVKESGYVNTSILAGKKILVTDDNEMNRLVASTILKYYGATIDEAQNGAEAIAKLEEETFDLVLMDVQMPVMDGMEATKTIREKISKTLPVIALTALAIKGDEAKFINAGMNDYLSKPFEENQLLLILSKWLKNAVPAIKKDTVLVTGKLYDLSKLEDIAKGNKAFVDKMVNLFIQQGPESVKEIKDAHKAEDFEKVNKLAHRLKTSINTLGISSLKDDIFAIEMSDAMAQKTENFKALISKLDTVVREVVQALSVN